MNRLPKKSFSFCLFLILVFILSCNSVSELYLIRKSNKWGYINKSGKTIIPPGYENCCINRQEDSCCSRIIWPGQLGIIKQNNYYGAVDNTGKIKIRPQYDFLDQYHHSLIIAKSENKFGILDFNGDTIFPFIFDNQFIGCNSKTGHGQIDGKMYLLDFEKKVKNLTDFDKISYYSEGYAAVKKDDKYGFINESGEIVIDLKFQEVWPFNKGLAAVKINYQWGFIDTSDKFILEPRYDETQGFDNITGKYAVVVKNGRYGLIDRYGNYIIEPRYQFLYPEDKNVFTARIDKGNYIKKGLINLKEKWLTKEIEEDFDYYNGYLKILKNDRFGLYRLNNHKAIVPCVFDDIIFRSMGLTMLIYTDKLTRKEYFAYINKKGKIVWAENGFEMKDLIYKSVE